MNDFWGKVIFKLGDFNITLSMLLAVGLLFIITWLLLLVIRKLLLQNKQLSISEKGRRLSFYQLIKYFIWVISISFAVKLIGFDLTLLLAGSAALLVGIGFGLQNIFSDLIAGLFMLFEQKVNAGDVMEVDNIVGKVQKVNLRTSVLLTRDGYNIIVPNHKFITENVINWSHKSFNRRFQVEVGVSYNSDIDLVTNTLIQCSENQEELLKDETHKPFVRFQDFGESALIFYLMFWTTDIFRVEQVKSDLRYKIFKAFKEKNISIPYPQRDIHINQS